MSKYNLYLDDLRDPIDSSYYLKNSIYVDLDWVVVRNYDEFIRIIIDNGLPDVISFDHDIYYEEEDAPEKTGYDCAKWLINYCIDNEMEVPDKILIHSMNPVGSQNIKSLFDSYWKSLGLPFNV